MLRTDAETDETSRDPPQIGKHGRKAHNERRCERFGAAQYPFNDSALDGNLHPLILFDVRDEEETARVKKAGTEILRSCVDAGGTISGEHGIGLEKLEEMAFIFTSDDIEAMLKFKKAFDPADQLNPGKVLPQASS